ncbi:cytochrome P450 [Xylaria flabelliformis]|nr:cytochrome P450 [Xylaria flabelliformis]
MEVNSELVKSNHFYSLGALGLLVLLLVLSSARNDPLANVPGPWYAKWTELVGKYYWVTAQKSVYIHNLHLKYGPIVRVGPREVYTADPKAVQQVFRIKKEFLKAQWYLAFAPFVLTIFNVLEVPVHRRLRRLLSNPLSETGLRPFYPQIEHKVDLAIDGIKKEFKTRGVADVYKWWFFFATDVVGEMSFGEGFRMLESGKVNQYITDLQSVGELAAYRSAFPSLLQFSMRFGIPLPFLSKAQSSAKRIKNYSKESLKRHAAIVEKEGHGSRPTLFTKIYDAENDDTITQDEMADNAQSYIVAGSDTTSNTLTFFTWAVCRHPEVKAKLLKELEVLPDNFTYEDMRQTHLPYLEQCVNETLRRYPSVPAGLPREVPEGGAEICGYHIPAGYTVSQQNYSLHRNPDAFPDPEKFDPSRWENPTQVMKDSFIPFGGGSRICIGLHLGKVEVKLAAARFFKAFPNAKVSTREGMKDEDMSQKLFFLSTPKAHRCLLELE